MAIDLLKEMTALRRMILSMGAAVEQRVQRATTALLDHDLETALLVRTGDREIDQMELEIEEECLRVLALLHPVAGDLRFVLAVMRINANLERIADMAKGIAKRVLDLEELHRVEHPPSLRLMAESTCRMLAEALRALSDQSAAIAYRVRNDDQRIDDLLKEIFTWAQSEIPHHIENTEAAIHLLSVARKLERIADVATNIAEDVIFFAEGSLVRHDLAKHVRATA
jgi:phosphate transport system protein